MEELADKEIDLHHRIRQKQLQRDQNIIDLETERLSKSELQRRNSMFSGIDWSAIEIIEPGGYCWQPIVILTETSRRDDTK